MDFKSNENSHSFFDLTTYVHKCEEKEPITPPHISALKQESVMRPNSAYSFSSMKFMQDDRIYSCEAKFKKKSLMKKWKIFTVSIMIQIFVFQTILIIFQWKAFVCRFAQNKHTRNSGWKIWIQNSMNSNHSKSFTSFCIIYIHWICQNRKYQKYLWFRKRRKEIIAMFVV